MMAPQRESFRLIRLILGLTLILFFGILGWTLKSGLSIKDPGSQAQMIIEVAKGTTPQEISKRLEALQIIDNSQSFLWFGKITRKWKKIRMGEYRVSPSQSAFDLFSTLTSGISIIHPVTVKEGNNLYEVAKAVENEGLASAAEMIELAKSSDLVRQLLPDEPNAKTLEGFLFPDTYHFTKVMPKADLLKQMVRKFQATWTPQMTERANQLGMTRYQIVTLASMVEKETGASFERPLISSVFHNRLKRKMRLQSDPTTIYGIWHRYTGNIKKSDLLEPSDYNTYTREALPLGPIANPGKEALLAALYPAESPHLFFVSKNDGTHSFTDTYGAHLSKVKTFQLDPKARNGKSWRDLKKNATRAN